ncbi:MAG: tRNA-dependent cyclodipeptide synthase [Candidatus Uhrbacteria bacterium]|nr:tRNA-dependent cyclodipeptide synthase [Candidatus Uhrbacteria bacterium]
MLVTIFPAEKENLLRTSRGYISISLSNNTSASTARLREIIEWTRNHVSSFDIVIGDYFHRHNIEDQQDVTEQRALDIAVEEGKLRIRRIRKLLDSLDLSHVKILSAAELCRESPFRERVDAFEKLWETDLIFQRFIEEGVNAFLERKSVTHLHTASARRHSKFYQIEELALFELLVIEGYGVNIYPGAHLPVMKEITSGCLREGSPSLAEMILVELRIGKGL